jgi:hypothetical protein
MKRNIRLDKCIAIIRIVLLSILVLTFIFSYYCDDYYLVPSSAGASLSSSPYVPTLSYNTDDRIPYIINDATLKVE